MCGALSPSAGEVRGPAYRHGVSAGTIEYSSAVGRGVVLAAVLGSGMAMLDGTVVNVALKTIGKDLDASLAQLQWITNGYLLIAGQPDPARRLRSATGSAGGGCS